MFQAAILIAGEGVQLKAQGITASQPFIQTGGIHKTERIIRQLQAVGAGEVICIINQGFPEVLTHLQVRTIGISAHFIVKSTPNSFYSLCELIPFLQAGPFLLSLGDPIFDTRELDHFVHYALQRPRLDALLAVTDLIEDETSQRLRREKENEAIAIRGDAETSPYLTGGVYWFSERIARATNLALARGVNQMRDFLAFLLDEGYTLEGYWFRKIIDVDTVNGIDLK